MDAKGIEFTLDLARLPERVTVDELRSNQAFHNLLSNAAKYTSAGGRVMFYVEEIQPRDDRLDMRFSVRDNGIGMSEEFCGICFEAFSQERTRKSSEIQGSGSGSPSSRTSSTRRAARYP